LGLSFAQPLPLISTLLRIIERYTIAEMPRNPFPETLFHNFHQDTELIERQYSTIHTDQQFYEIAGQVVLTYILGE
jgi:hypothetical protein